MHRPVWLIAALLVTAAVARADDAEWPRFRGPDGLGISAATDLPVQWTEKDYKWKVKLPGIGHSSPVLWGGKLFVTCGDTSTSKRTILCLNAADGRTLWKRDYPLKTYDQNADNSYATSTPAADADGLYVAWTTPKEVTLLALDPKGEELWKLNLGPFVAEHGSGASPVVVGDTVVLGNDQDPGGKSFLIGVDRKTGQTRWKIDRRQGDYGSYATPCLRRPEGGPAELVFPSTAHGLTAIDPATGKTNWEKADACGGRCVGSPIVAEGLAIESYGWGEPGGVRCVAVRPGSADKKDEPKQVWEYTDHVPMVPTPLAKDGRLYLWADTGHVTCLRAATGEKVWREKLKTEFYGSPVWAAGRLYAISKAGDVFVLAAADKFELLARVPLGEKSFATPAIAGGVMYLRTYSQIMALGGGAKP